VAFDGDDITDAFYLLAVTGAETRARNAGAHNVFGPSVGMVFKIDNPSLVSQGIRYCVAEPPVFCFYYACLCYFLRVHGSSPFLAKS